MDLVVKISKFQILRKLVLENILMEMQYFFSVMSFLIIAMIFFMIYFFNNYSALFLIVILGFILYSILDDTLEVMLIERKNGEQIIIPINKTIDKIMGYGTEDIVDRFLKEVLEKNPQVIIQKNIHKKI